MRIEKFSGAEFQKAFSERNEPNSWIVGSNWIMNLARKAKVVQKLVAINY